MDRFSWCIINITIKHAGLGLLFTKQESCFLPTLKAKTNKKTPTTFFCREYVKSYVLDIILIIFSLQHIFDQRPPSGE